MYMRGDEGMEDSGGERRAEMRTEGGERYLTRTEAIIITIFSVIICLGICFMLLGLLYPRQRDVLPQPMAVYQEQAEIQWANRKFTLDVFVVLGMSLVASGIIAISLLIALRQCQEVNRYRSSGGGGRGGRKSCGYSRWSRGRRADDECCGSTDDSEILSGSRIYGSFDKEESSRSAAQY